MSGHLQVVITVPMLNTALLSPYHEGIVIIIWPPYFGNSSPTVSENYMFPSVEATILASAKPALFLRTVVGAFRPALEDTY